MGATPPFLVILLATLLALWFPRPSPCPQAPMWRDRDLEPIPVMDNDPDRQITRVRAVLDAQN